MMCKLVPEEWLLTLAALCNKLLVFTIFIWLEGEEETEPYVPKKKRPPKPPNEHKYIDGSLFEIVKWLFQTTAMVVVFLVTVQDRAL